MTTGERIRDLRKRKGWTMEELGEKLGVQKSAVNKWEHNMVSNMKRTTIRDLAKLLEVSPAYLMGWTDTPDGMEPLPKFKMVPLIGEIACGVPALAEQNHIGTAAVPEGISADFALICRGDSMINARINNGDIVFIRRQPMVENNQIAAVRIGTEATLKRVRFIGGKVVLWPENPDYEPIMVTEDMDVEIMGLAVCFFSQVI